jgi:hypothetical protein
LAAGYFVEAKDDHAMPGTRDASIFALKWRVVSLFAVIGQCRRMFVIESRGLEHIRWTRSSYHCAEGKVQE